MDKQSFRTDDCAYCDEKRVKGFTLEFHFRRFDLNKSYYDLHVAGTSFMCLECLYHHYLECKKIPEHRSELLGLLHPPIIKSGIRGFCDPDIRFEKQTVRYVPQEVMADLDMLSKLDRAFKSLRGDIRSSALFWQGNTGAEVDIYLHFLKRFAEEPAAWLSNTVYDAVQRSKHQPYAGHFPPSIHAAERIRALYINNLARGGAEPESYSSVL